MKVPLPLKILAAPVVGGAFVIALPAIGLGVALHAAGKVVARRVKEGAAGLAAVLGAQPAAGEAHFAGGPEADGGHGAKAAGRDQALEDLGREIEARRRDRS